MNENEISILNDIHNLNLNIIDLIRTQQARFIELHVNIRKNKSTILVNPSHISVIVPNPNSEDEGHYSIIHMGVDAGHFFVVETPEEIHKMIDKVNKIRFDW